MLIEEVLEVTQDKDYDVSIRVSKKLTYIVIRDNQQDVKVSNNFFERANLSVRGIANEILATLYTYELEHDRPDTPLVEVEPDEWMHPDELLSPETLAKLNVWEQSNYLPDLERTERIIDRMAEAIAGATLENATQPADVMGIVDPTELLATDEVSEARMSYYVIELDSPMLHSDYYTDIVVKVDEYRVVVKAGYKSGIQHICVGCGQFDEEGSCELFMGGQKELDKGKWHEVHNVEPDWLLTPAVHLVQKLPSEIANDN